MAQFYASIQGNRGQATRMGTKNSGIQGHIRGWDVGVAVECSVDKGGHDVCYVYTTGGSNGVGSRIMIASVTKDEVNHGLHHVQGCKRMRAIKETI